MLKIHSYIHLCCNCDFFFPSLCLIYENYLYNNVLYKALSVNSQGLVYITLKFLFNNVFKTIFTMDLQIHTKKNKITYSVYNNYISRFSVLKNLNIGELDA